MLNNEKALIVTAMKNEGPYVLEWFAHYLSVGFDSFLVFTNDCDDLTDRMLDRLATVVEVKHQPNPKSLFADKGNWQVMALRYATLFNLYRDAGWIFHVDADEFLQIKTGLGTLDDFGAAVGAFDVVSFTSMPYNSNGVLRLKPDFVSDQFTQYSKFYSDLRQNGQSELNAIKTMFRNQIEFRLRRNHRPLLDGFSKTGYAWVDGSGNRLDQDFVDGEQKTISPFNSTRFAEFGHYAIKSAESFLLKVDRGDVAGDPRLDRSRKYWASYNTPGDPMPAFAHKSSRFGEIYAALLGDPVLAEMHAASFDIHQRKVARILATASGQEKAVWLGLT